MSNICIATVETSRTFNESFLLEAFVTVLAARQSSRTFVLINMDLIPLSILFANRCNFKEAPTGSFGRVICAIEEVWIGRVSNRSIFNCPIESPLGLS